MLQKNLIIQVFLIKNWKRKIKNKAIKKMPMNKYIMKKFKIWLNKKKIKILSFLQELLLLMSLKHNKVRIKIMNKIKSNFNKCQIYLKKIMKIAKFFIHNKY